MRLKTFAAPDMTAAMKLVRDTLGPDAIIVSAESNGKGDEVTVMAAVEPKPDDRPAKARQTESKVQARIGASFADNPSEKPIPSTVIADALAYHRIPDGLREPIVRMSEAHEDENGILALAAALDTCLRFHPLAPAFDGWLMLVGPPGSGKTVTTAKILARAALANRLVSVFTTDTERAGAIEQIGALATVMGQPLTLAHTADELQKKLADLSAGRNAVIDTLGVNPYSREDMRDLEAYMTKAAAAATASGTRLETLLVLPAGIDAEEAAETAGIFSGLGIQRLVATRIDCARRLGGMLAAADAGRLALSDVGLQPFIADGLKPLNPVSLARLLLNHFEPGAQRKALDRAAS